MLIGKIYKYVHTAHYFIQEEMNQIKNKGRSKTCRANLFLQTFGFKIILRLISVITIK